MADHESMFILSARHPWTPMVPHENQVASRAVAIHSHQRCPVALEFTSTPGAALRIRTPSAQGGDESESQRSNEVTTFQMVSVISALGFWDFWVTLVVPAGAFVARPGSLRGKMPAF